MINHRNLLPFERASDPELQLIPMVVRMKLDLAGCKISLAQWQQLSPASRARLTNTRLAGPEHTCRFRQYLNDTLKLAGCPPAEDLTPAKRDDMNTWSNPDLLPRELRARWEELGTGIEWRALSTFGRYVAWSLLRKGREKRLLAALPEAIMHDSGDYSPMESTVPIREALLLRSDNHP